MAKSPINWFGGKYYMASDIIQLFPKHSLFVEGFGGAGHIILKKTPSAMEVYNDIHSGLYLFFKLLRDENKELIRKIQLTPYSREEFLNCRGSWQKEIDDVEKVRKFYVETMQSVGGSGGWCYAKSKSRRGMCQSVSRWLGNVDENLIDVVDRLRELQIDHLDILNLIDKYDGENTLFYLDPPYIHDTRTSSKMYEHEMSNEKHCELVNRLLRVVGNVVLSGYNHEIYNALNGVGKWRKIFLGDYAKRSQKSNDGVLDVGSEFVWINFEVI